MYFDNAATTRLSRRALAAMLPFMEGEQGNPSSLHSYAREARKALEQARTKIAGCLGAEAEEIVFTSGGSEGNNYLLRGAVAANHSKGRHVITSAVEHPSVLNTLYALERQGSIELTVLPVDRYGRVSVVDVFAALRPDTILISVMPSSSLKCANVIFPDDHSVKNAVHAALCECPPLRAFPADHVPVHPVSLYFLQLQVFRWIL